MADAYNLYPLHVFRTVARLGSVTRAAGELLVSQPAVSAHLRALEERYGERLFERTPHGMLLTEAGAALLDRADRLIALYDEVPSALDAVRGRVRGEVTLAASSTPGAYIVPGMLARFRERHPEVRPVLAVGDSAEVLAWIREYRVAVGVTGETGVDADLDRVAIASDELRLVAAAGDPLCETRRVGPRHVAHRTLFLRERGSSTRAGAEALLGDLAGAFERVVEIRDTETVKQLVVSGLGVAVLSSWATRLEEEAALVRPVCGTKLCTKRSFYLVRRKDRELVGRSLALWRFIAANAA